eukprot:TRINITY_DN17057_c0_g1_i3.p1 TRINITY_DN17057_c0_g1~~TRINITY_DN17057_c0_g1_i3.p1  ORF type:complete len:128 (-),score=8.14 TRINITY_DN17057_c0_g1_i3:49-432(-)
MGRETSITLLLWVFLSVWLTSPSLMPSLSRKQEGAPSSGTTTHLVGVAYTQVGTITLFTLRVGAQRIEAPSLCVVSNFCLLYTSDAADEEDSVDLGGRRIIKKKKKEHYARTTTRIDIIREGRKTKK